ncbi:hypothetical protein Tco_0395016, partial [Tanacetum coccineum]
FQVNKHWLTLSADLLRKALNVTPADSAHPFESPPGGKMDDMSKRLSSPIRVTSSWYSNELGSFSGIYRVAIREPAP